MNNIEVNFLFAWYDLWIGLYWDAKKRWLYIMPIPMCGIIIKFLANQTPPNCGKVTTN